MKNDEKKVRIVFDKRGAILVISIFILGFILYALFYLTGASVFGLWSTVILFLAIMVCTVFAWLYGSARAFESYFKSMKEKEESEWEDL